MSVINQKEYLKKYLGIGRDASANKKRKKKKVKTEYSKSRLTIIDDNIDTFNNAVQEDLIGESEDAPQIVEIIDDRPPSLMIDEKSNTHLWIPIGGSNNSTINYESNKDNHSNLIKQEITDSSQVLESQEQYSGISYLSPENIIIKREVDSPVDRDGDLSPPRKRDEQSTEIVTLSQDLFSHRTALSEMAIVKEVKSPVREDGDLSPPRKRNIVSSKSSNENLRTKDLSPKRKFLVKPEDQISSLKYISDTDNSSHRRQQKTEGLIPSREKSVKLKPQKNDAMSPPRKKSRKAVLNNNSILDHENKSKVSKTLDGKTAGLQNANELMKETKEISRREEELFRNIPSNISGAMAPTVVRDRKSGKVRNIEEEAEKELEKKKREDENKEKYSRWGRGLKQVEDVTTKIQEELNEMSKPLARYADDEDLEKYLKEQEREGDPMLAYIRKKKKKKDLEEGKPVKPVYQGEFMPNRYGIRPGHRWDGVDRSNGYEKRRFEVLNSKLAQQEESFKWSTEDM